MEQSICDSEEIVERRSLLKGVFKPMKEWFINLPENLQQRFGPYPMFWQDLECWSHTKILMRGYLMWSEKRDGGIDFQFSESFPLEANSVVISSKDEDEVKIDGSNEVKNSESNPAPTQRKRKNRWCEDTPDTGVSSDCVQPNQTSVEVLEMSTLPDDVNLKQRKSRWAPAVASSQAFAFTPIQNLPMTAETLQESLILKMRLQNIQDRMITVSLDAAKIELDPSRSPSPPPKYDASGKRSNTREMRMRENLGKEKIKIIEDLIKIDSTFLPPADFVRVKPFKKMYIPMSDNPAYNFIGLIIGPRGNTQKKMELETGCKISIRGKGSVKEGSRGRASKIVVDEDDELHVHIQGEDMAKVEIATKMVEEILRPVDDEINEHKQKQLRELALINGTLREEEYCPVCGEKGHRQFECPTRTKAFKSAGVKCAICGDLSHPTRDCPMKQEEQGASEHTLDVEYSSFMAELSDGKSSSRPNTHIISNQNSLSSSLSSSVSMQSANSNSSSNISMASVNVLSSSADICHVIAPLASLPEKKPQTVIHMSYPSSYAQWGMNMGIQTPNQSYYQHSNPNPTPAPDAAAAGYYYNNQAQHQQAPSHQMTSNYNYSSMGQQQLYQYQDPTAASQYPSQYAPVPAVVNPPLPYAPPPPPPAPGPEPRAPGK